MIKSLKTLYLNNIYETIGSIPTTTTSTTPIYYCHYYHYYTINLPMRCPEGLITSSTRPVIQ